MSSKIIHCLPSSSTVLLVPISRFSPRTATIVPPDSGPMDGKATGLFKAAFCPQRKNSLARVNSKTISLNHLREGANTTTKTYQKAKPFRGGDIIESEGDSDHLVLCTNRLIRSAHHPYRSTNRDSTGQFPWQRMDLPPPGDVLLAFVLTEHPADPNHRDVAGIRS